MKIGEEILRVRHNEMDLLNSGRKGIHVNGANPKMTPEISPILALVNSRLAIDRRIFCLVASETRIAANMSRGGKLAPEVNRALFVKNLRLVFFVMIGTEVTEILDSYNVTPEELFDLFGKFGPVR